MSHTRLIARAVLCLVCLSMVERAFAQKEVEAPVFPEYVIEVGDSGGCSFAPLKRANGQQGEFKAVLSKPPPASPRGEASPSVWTVTVTAQPAGELWRVNVSVGLGEYYDGGAQQVATYALQTNERAEVSEVMQYGVQTFRVAVVRVSAAAARAPRVMNRTQSIVVEKLEARPLPEPYQLALKNRSGKDVLAIQINSHKGGNFSALRWHEEGRSRPLIKAGDSHRIAMLSEDRACAGTDGYRPTQSDTLEISAVVFADGSYEGTAGLAALIRAKSLGHAQHLSRVLELFNSWDERDNLSPAEITYYFRSVAGGIEEMAESHLLNELQSHLPELGLETIPALGKFLRHGQHEIKTNLLADARDMESISAKGLETQVETKIVAEWLARTKAKYAGWLAAAQAVAAR
ncbi:MAG TPA: hypothetical protein VK388_17315 [Pyrinomonadaceae bacterium]|nr:hypothetical protein [Pyrinomonadaceae bacterium]